MVLKKKLIWWLTGLAIVAGVGWALWSRYWFYIPGIIGTIKEPIQPTMDVKWTSGPLPLQFADGQRPPNVVLILADDMGFNDVTFWSGGVSGKTVPTPAIDSIAKEGVAFSSGYAGNATCAPSRAALMTGRYATRFGYEFTPAPLAMAKLIGKTMHGNGADVIYHADREADVPPFQEMHVPTSEVMLGEILGKQGYRTFHLGKWHLGETPATRPEARGFDETLSMYSGAGMYLPKDDPNVVNSMQEFDPIDRFLWANLPFAITHNGSKRFKPPEYMTDYLSNEAVKIIAANKNRPFFIYLAYNAPHTPLQALKSDYDALSHIKDHRLRVYAAMIKAIDRGVGKVLTELKAQGLDDNTIVMFTSDNGGANYIGLPDINMPYRGFKATFFEGGIRVPFFMKWPGKIPACTVYRHPVGHVDVFATAVAAAGAKMPTDRVIDGVDLVPFVTGRKAGRPHKSLFFRSGNYRVLLSGDWKLQVDDTQKKIWLFDMAKDPTEKKNVADAEPARLAALQAELARINTEQVKPLWPSVLEGSIYIDAPVGTPGYGKGEYIYWAN
jgi:arylsulfatase A-like enzyme